MRHIDTKTAMGLADLPADEGLAVIRAHAAMLGSDVEHAALVADLDGQEMPYGIDPVVELYEGCDLMANRRLREHFTQTYSWSVPCREAVEALLRFMTGPVIDPLAGTGFWAKILTDRGLLVHAFDVATIKQDNQYKHTARWAPVTARDGRVTMDANGQDKDILLGWPPYIHPVYDDDPNDTVPVVVRDDIGLAIVQKVTPGRRIAYFGEGWGGCTGSEAMNSWLSENCTRLCDSVYAPNFDGIHDELTIFERKRLCD